MLSPMRYATLPGHDADDMHGLTVCSLVSALASAVAPDRVGSMELAGNAGSCC